MNNRWTLDKPMASLSKFIPNLGAEERDCVAGVSKVEGPSLAAGHRVEAAPARRSLPACPGRQRTVLPILSVDVLHLAQSASHI